MREILGTLLSTVRADVMETPGRCDVAESVFRLAERFDPAGPAIYADVAPVPCVVGVPGEIAERILTPILDNARRYARTQIAVSVDGTRISIADDGPGAAPAAREAMFEPGWRGDPADGHDGAGLGLALARRLARAAGGDVVLAETGPGAVFDVLLPPGECR